VTTGTTVAIGATDQAATMLDKALPAGPWNATITMKSGLVEVSDQATITFPEAGEAAPVAAAPVPSATESSTPGWLLPAIIGLGVLLLGVAVLLVFVLRRRRT